MSSRIKPIPSGMHTLTPHLVVKGASKAIEFYKKVVSVIYGIEYGSLKFKTVTVPRS